MTHGELMDRLTMREFLEWGAYFKIEVEEMQERNLEQQAKSLARKNFHR